MGSIINPVKPVIEDILGTAIAEGYPDHSIYEVIEHLHHISHHDTNIFPADSNLTCTLTAAATANLFSSWIEIEDNTSGTTIKFTAAFASDAGHIGGMILESVSQDDTIYMLELAFGASKNMITRWRFAGATKFLNASHAKVVKGQHIDAGETVYYRMKTATGVADTAVVHFRYFIE